MTQRTRYESGAVAVKERAARDDGRQERFAAKLRASFDDAPVEDGMGHPAEDIIGEALASEDRIQVLDWLRALCADASQPSFAASVLRCLCRRDSVGTTSWRVSLVRDGLSIHSTEVRDAAVQAVEWWADQALLEVLRAHTEPEPWLRQYIHDVIGDLDG